MLLVDALNPEHEHDLDPDLDLDYEAERQATIKANQDLLESLGLAKQPVIRTPSVRRVVRPSSQPTRRSARVVASSSSTSTPTRPSQRRVITSSNATIKTRKSNQASERDFVARDDLQRVYQGSVAGRVHDPKKFGAIPGVEVGRCWEQRAGASRDAVHAPLVAGIYGNSYDGARSVCFAAGYEDNVDEGEMFILVGAGGRDLRGTKAAPKNLRTAPQTSNQSLDHGMNAALAKSAQTGKPVRVCRGFKTNSMYAPLEGYRYDGLYVVERAWLEKSKVTGFKICKFKFTRLPGQPRIPLRTDETDSAVAGAGVVADSDTTSSLGDSLALATIERMVCVEIPSSTLSASSTTTKVSKAPARRSERQVRSERLREKPATKITPSTTTSKSARSQSSRFWYYEEIEDDQMTTE